LNENSAPRIAIPIPKSDDPDYTNRALPQYEKAVADAGGQPVRIPLDQTPAEAMKLISHCDGVLLPGSGADVDPAKYSAVRDPNTAAADPKRDTVDELLLQDAYNMRKPVLAICYGLQILNVYRSGTLIQHIPEFLPAGKKSLVNQREIGAHVISFAGALRAASSCCCTSARCLRASAASFWHRRTTRSRSASLFT